MGGDDGVQKKIGKLKLVYEQSLNFYNMSSKLNHSLLQYLYIQFSTTLTSIK